MEKGDNLAGKTRFLRDGRGLVFFPVIGFSKNSQLLQQGED